MTSSGPITAYDYRAAVPHPAAALSGPARAAAATTLVFSFALHAASLLSLRLGQNGISVTHDGDVTTWLTWGEGKIERRPGRVKLFRVQPRSLYALPLGFARQWFTSKTRTMAGATPSAADPRTAAASNYPSATPAIHRSGWMPATAPTNRRILNGCSADRIRREA